MKQRDAESYKIIKKHHEKTKGKAGIRAIKMLIERSEGEIFSCNRIERIKKKYNLITQIRKRNKYKQFAKKKQEHKVAPNLLNREFKQDTPNKVFSTDITVHKYHKRKAYTVAFKDLCTNEIVASHVSSRIDMSLVLKGLKKAIRKVPLGDRKDLMIHSDQGFHFTHISYRELLKRNNITQSMSRKGNCIDNAPIESLFGHLKDWIDLKDCKNIGDVRKEVTKQIRYYNYRRPQVGLKKMTPAEYRGQFNL